MESHNIKNDILKNLIIDFAFQRYIKLNKQVEKEFIEFVQQKNIEYILINTSTSQNVTQTLYETLYCHFKTENDKIEKNRQLALQRKKEYLKKQNMLRRQQQTKQLQSETLNKKQKVDQPQQQNNKDVQANRQNDEDVQDYFAEINFTNEDFAMFDCIETLDNEDLQNKISQEETPQNELPQKETPQKETPQNEVSKKKFVYDEVLVYDEPIELSQSLQIKA
ncbi:hypothetical protein [Olene mendosa nucleopolyhedrovirus]|uniref:Uncharacterized protein n=1 Tax=Olene mendosa nucleopolyhedrovirus TaxID=2933796 RepID=A0AAX3AU27_9ABAC|nr:hypothetical protein QKV28_gp008 [Olene mendosa nucleopolyhedrovirus]UOQ18791.1 hypothetical protein [Olene mendosa nucleopolyhedrovirus]